MATYERSVMQQIPQGHVNDQQALSDTWRPVQRFYRRPSPHQGGKEEATIWDYPPEQRYRAAPQRRKYYIPKVLRTGFLLAFCIFTLLVFALLQGISIAYIKAYGFEALAIDWKNSKREAYAQTSDISCPSGATCAPAPGSWTDATLSDVPISTAPGPGSFTNAISIYFLGAYAPTILAILLGIWWMCIFARLKEMEPYNQLAKRTSSSSEDSLFLSYSSDMLPVALFKSFRAKHWATFVGSINKLLLTIVTLLAAETLHLIGVGDGCGVVMNAKGKSNDDCEMQPKVRPVLGFILGGILLAVLVGTVLLMIRLRRRPSGLLSEATSIAGIASLSTPELLQESPQSLRNSSRRFALNLSESDGSQSIVEITPAVQQPMLLLAEPAQDSQYSKIKSHWELRPASLTLFLLYQAAILVLILYYRYVSQPGTNDPIEDFMNSESFGVRLFMTCLGLGTKFYWCWIEKYMRRMSPYVALAGPGGASAQKSILMTTHSHPVTALFSRDTWRHGTLGPVTLMAVLSEILVVTLNTVSFTDTTAYTAFQVSVYFCVVILGLMILTVPLVILWAVRVRKNQNVAEAPECIAEVFGMIRDIWILRGFSGINAKDRMKVVDGWNVRFATRRVHDSWQIITTERKQ